MNKMKRTLITTAAAALCFVVIDARYTWGTKGAHRTRVMQSIAISNNSDKDIRKVEVDFKFVGTGKKSGKEKEQRYGQVEVKNLSRGSRAIVDPMKARLRTPPFMIPTKHTPNDHFVKGSITDITVTKIDADMKNEWRDAEMKDKKGGVHNTSFSIVREGKHYTVKAQ